MKTLTQATYKFEKYLRRASSQIEGTFCGNSINVAWWDGSKNFGDSITPELFSHFGCAAINSFAPDARFAGVGSILHLLPSNFSGTVLGSGAIDERDITLEKARFSFVRGEMTKHLLHLAKDTPTGDLGLLAARMLQDGKQNSIHRKTYGLIPHYVDRGSEWFRQAKVFLGENCTVIDVRSSAKRVIREIGNCDVIVSSSLHGIIVADSLHIPNTWVVASDDVLGRGFKFKDYNTSIDYDQVAVDVSRFTGMQEIEKHLSTKNIHIIDKKVSQLNNIFAEELAKTG